MRKNRSRRKPPVKFDVHRTISPRLSDTKPSAQSVILDRGTRRWSWRKSIVALLAVFFIAVITITTWDAINLSRASQKLFGSGNILTLLSSKPPKGADSGRINTLLIGYSIDDPGHPGATLTDSLILLSLSTDHHQSYMLSIPRDLYVNIPGFGYGKINEVYRDGGTALLDQIVSQTLGIKPNYHIVIDYSAVRNLVNALGGIKVNIQSPDQRGLYDPNINKNDGGPLRLTNGWHSLDGQTALNLTRARGDDYRAYGFPQADFDRTQHQRQVLNAIKTKLDWWLMLNPLKNGKIAQALAQHIKTDIGASEVRRLFGAYNSVPESQMLSVGLRDVNGQNYLTSFDGAGMSALVPVGGINNYSQIQNLIIKFNSTPTK